MAALQHPTQSSISLPLLHCPAMAVTQCPAVERSGVVGDICSSPPAKSPHHMVLFMHSLFHIPAMWKKPRNTQNLSKWQQRKYNYRKHIHHQPCPEPTVACAACEPGWEDEPVVQSVLSTITAEPWNLHSTFFLSVFLTLCAWRLSCQWMQTVSGTSAVKGLGSTSTFWSLVQRWKLSHVWGSRSGKSLAVSRLAKTLVCRLEMQAGLRHTLADLGL